jgi:branched-chain amino acid transport system substrate-binding protein
MKQQGKLTMTKLMTGAAVVAVMTAPAAHALDGEPIKIGYAAAITGGLAPYDSVPGAQCAVAKINEAGGVLGRPLELMARDMKSDPVTSSVVAQELIDSGVTAILAPPTDDTAIPIAALAMTREIPVLSVGSTQVQLPMASPTNTYLTAYGDNLAAGAVAQIAIDRGITKAATLVSRDYGAYGVVIPEYFADAFTHLGGEIVGSVNYNIGLSDYNAQVAEVQTMEPAPEILVGGLLMPEAGVFPRQFKAANVDVEFMGTDGFDDPGLIEISGAGGPSITFVTHGFPSEGSELAQFYSDCSAMGYEMENVFFALGGEAVMLIADAISRAGSDDPAAVNAALAETEGFDGLTSDSITYKGQGGVPLKEMAIVTIQDGKFVSEGTIMPSYIPAP